MKESKKYLSEQIITYLGNKRLLIPHIEKEILQIKKNLKKEFLYSADLFSGSGIVARMLKQHSSELYVNDLELYSYIINSCYLSNQEDFPEEEYYYYYRKLQDRLRQPITNGLIAENYAPRNLHSVSKEERVFYTPENAAIIDTTRHFIDEIPESIRKFFLAPLLYEASVHVNTGGVFKGFYKDKNTGIGKFGGAGENALTRIMGKIEVKKPVLSRFSAQISISQQDVLKRIETLPMLDVLYLDPPYNQHPYGSNYFMLNVIAENRLPGKISKVSGIPNNWNRSEYNSRKKAFHSLQNLLSKADAHYIILSYNSEGFISKTDILNFLSEIGRVKVLEVSYNTYRGSRNLRARETYVKEYIFVVKKHSS